MGAFRATDETLMQIMDLGVSGLVDRLSSAVVIESAIRLVGEGERYFSERLLWLSKKAVEIAKSVERVHQLKTLNLMARQKSVLTLLAEGFSNKEIGQQLGISTSTVKIHVEVLIEKLAASHRTQVSIICKTLGII